jgi:hypothetical protein
MSEESYEKLVEHRDVLLLRLAECHREKEMLKELSLRLLDMIREYIREEDKPM